MSTAAYSFLDGLFLSPPPQVEDPDRVVTVFSRPTEGGQYLPVSYTTYQTLEREAESFVELGASQIVWLGLGGTERPERVMGEISTASYFETLGVEPALGRFFTDEESDPRRHERVVVLSHRLWQDDFGGERSVLDHDLEVNGEPYRIVGVAPERFKGTNALNAPVLWAPLSVYEEIFVDPDMFAQHNGRVLNVVGRLAKGTGLETAQEETASAAAGLLERYPDAYREQKLELMSVREAQVYPGARARLWRTSLFLMILGGLLLASACVNVANLLLIQAFERGREFAIRLSLGARRKTLIGQLLGENLLLAVLGCGLGLLVAHWLWRILWSFRPPYFDRDALGFQLDLPTVVFACGVALATSLLFGFLPILRALRSTPSEALKEGTVSLRGPGSRRLPVGAGLVIVQVCLSTVMLAAAGLFLGNLQDSRQVDLGFDIDHILTLSWDTQSQGYTEEQDRALRRRTLERVRAMPGVEAVSLGENRPLGGFRLLREVGLWQDREMGEAGQVVGSSLVDADYFSTLAVSIVRGRDFDEGDRAGSPLVAVVNRELAETLSPDDPLGLVGAQLRIEDRGEPAEIVGIAETIKYIRPTEEARPALYLSSEQFYNSRSTLHVQTAGAPEALVGAIREEVQALDPLLPLLEVGTLDEHLNRALWALRMNVAVLGLFSVLALILAAAGVYGVTAYAVSQRTREIGIRLVLGAEHRQILRQVVIQGIVWVTTGVLLGIVAAFALGRWVGSLFHDVRLADLPTLSMTALAMVLAGGIASLAPAVRATRIDPVDAMRF